MLCITKIYLTIFLLRRLYNLNCVALEWKSQLHRLQNIFFSTGLVFSMAALAMLAASDDLTVTSILGLLDGSVICVGFASSGYRLVLEMVSPSRRSRMLLVVNCAGALGAAFACSLLPSLAAVGDSTAVSYR